MNIKQLRLITILGFLSVLFVSPYVLAVQEVKTITYRGGFYESVEAEVSSSPSTSFTFKPPDGFSELLYMKAIVKGEIDAKVPITLVASVEKKECVEGGIKVNKPTNEVIFDCTDVAHGTGEYNVELTTSEPIKNILIDWEFTYINNPPEKTDFAKKVYDEPQIEVFGTEYQFGNNAKAWIQLLDSDKHPIDNATCFFWSYYPNNTIFINKGIMPNLDDGIYYNDFIVPHTEGTYPMISECYVGAYLEDIETADGFILEEGVWHGGAYTDTQSSNNVRHKLVAYYGDTGNFNAVYNFTNMCEPSEDLMVGFNVFWEGYYRDAKNVGLVHIYNYTSGNYIQLSNTIAWGSSDITVSNIIEGFNNSTVAGLTDNGIMKIKFNNSANEHRAFFRTDYLYVSCLTLNSSNTVWEKVRGGSEMHVSGNLSCSIDYEHILSNTTTEINSAKANIISNLNTSIYDARDYLDNAVTTAQNYIISQLNTSIWNAHDSLNTTVWLIHDSIDSLISVSEENIKTNTTLELDDTESLITGLNNLSASEVWAYGTKEITGGNLSMMDWVVVNDLSNLATQDNTTELRNILNSLENLTASEVWAYATRDLTDYNQTDVWIYLEDINTSQITNADIWGYATRTLSNYSGVWSYGIRDLTDYNQTDLWIYLEDINTSISSMNGTTPAEVWSYATREITGGNLTTMDWATISDLSNLATQDNTTEIINLISSLNNISESDIWSYATRDLTDYNQTDMWVYLGDINTSQLSDADVWNYATRTLSNYSGVWSYSTRTLTDYNQTYMWIYLEDINSTVHGVMLINNTPILEAINGSENRVKIKIEDSEDDVIDEVHDARDDILNAIDGLENNITLELSYTEGNLSSLIIETENNLTIEIDNAEAEILDAIQICCNLTHGILENVTVNITAQCNPKEIWKYFYVNPLKTDTEKTIITGSFVAGDSNMWWLSILILAVIILITGVLWWRKNH